MLSRMISWFVIFGLSFWVEIAGYGIQETAFIWIYFILSPIIPCVILFVTLKRLNIPLMPTQYLFIAFFYVALAAVALALSYLISMILPVSLSHVFEIVTLIFALLPINTTITY